MLDTLAANARPPCSGVHKRGPFFIVGSPQLLRKRCLAGEQARRGFWNIRGEQARRLNVPRCVIALGHSDSLQLRQGMALDRSTDPRCSTSRKRQTGDSSCLIVFLSPWFLVFLFVSFRRRLAIRETSC